MPALAASPEAKSIVRADVRTGRLIRSVAVARPVPVTADLTNLIDRIATENGVEAPLVHSVILTESNYNPVAISPKGAQGLMQLIPATARRFGVSDSFDPAQNVQGGVRYLRYLLDYYRHDYVKAIAAYNAGEAAVDKYNGVPPYSETRNYVDTVSHNLKAARARLETKTVSMTPVNPDTPRSVIAFIGPDGKRYYRTP
jgi:soluble lytic murein transglycosylase-like protein